MKHSQHLLAAAVLSLAACSSSGTTAPSNPPPPTQITRLMIAMTDTAVIIGDRLPIRPNLVAYEGTNRLSSYMTDSMYRIGRISLTFPSFVRDSSGTAIGTAEGDSSIFARSGVVEYRLNIGVLYDLTKAANWKMTYSCRSNATGDSTASTVVGPITYPGTQQNFPYTTRWADLRGMQLDSTWRRLDGFLTVRGPYPTQELLQEKARVIVVGYPLAYHATAFLVDGLSPRTYRSSAGADARCLDQWSGTILTITAQ
jgi:hypothetical protein